MRPSTYVHALFHSYCKSQSTIRFEVINKERTSLNGFNIKTQFYIMHDLCWTE
jgi:hypothetical protein